jgi:hypothetical protein
LITSFSVDGVQLVVIKASIKITLTMVYSYFNFLYLSCNFAYNSTLT